MKPFSDSPDKTGIQCRSLQRFFRSILLMAAVVLLVPGMVRADESVSVRLGYIGLSPSGQLGVSLGGAAGTKVDVERDLGLGRSNQVTAEIQLLFGDSMLSASYLPIDSSGSGVLAFPVQFNGKTFTGPVQSGLKADTFDIGYTYFLINMDDLPSRFQLGAEVAVKVINAEARMSSTALGLNEAASATVPIPTLGVRGRIALADFVGVSGRIGYLGYAGNHFLDASAQIEFSPLPLVGIYGGYRHLNIRVDNSGIFLDTGFSGPFFGAFLRF
jgi:hypothetical protein